MEPALLVSRFRRTRERSRELFSLLSDDAYYSRPIALRHPIVFYEGHLPAFSFNTVVKKAQGGASIDPALEMLFARGIDPADEGRTGVAADDRARWPDRRTIAQFAAEADSRVIKALENAAPERSGRSLVDHREAVFAILEHEAMHQETLLYMWHRLPFEQKRRPAGYAPVLDGRAPDAEWIDVPAGPATLGVDPGAIPFGWDNEFPACHADVKAFSIERHNVTNAQYLDFVESGGYLDPQWWRPEDWQWIQAEKIAHPLFWERSDGRTKILRDDRDRPDGRTNLLRYDRDRPDGKTKALRYDPDRSDGKTNVLRYNRDRADTSGTKVARYDSRNQARPKPGSDDSNGTEWCWRGMFDLIALPLAWPVYVSHAEAAAYARWRGSRLPTEAEYQRAAYGAPGGERPSRAGSAAVAEPRRKSPTDDGRRYPWGDDAPSTAHGVFDFSSWDPEPAGSHPLGASAWGIEDLVGNGWEWTSTIFAPFPGFHPIAAYPEYSADFFDGEHFVMKGASPATARELLRPTFRNWFRARYPYVYASFRCVKDT